MHHQRAWHGGVCTHFIPQLSCYCILDLWAVVLVIQSAICWYLWVNICPSTKCMWAFSPFCQGRHPQPLHITQNLHPPSVDALVDVHGRSHSFPFIHPRGVFLAWCWMIARPLSSFGAVLLSFPLEVGLTGVGLVHLSHTWQIPMHKGTPASDMTRRSQLQCKVHEFPCWAFNLYEGMSVMIWCITLWGLSSHLSMIFLFPWKASALTKMRLPGFKPMVPIFQA